MLHVTVRQLQVFHAVARRSSFARAAEDLHLTPPAVSMQIKQLETQLGLPLFERGSGPPRLTLVGEYFLGHARKVLGTLGEAENLVARLRQAETGRLSLGMLSTAKYFVPHLLARFLREHPGVEVSLFEGNREQLITRVQRNEVDLTVMGRAPGELEARAEVIGTHPLTILAAPDHPLAKAEEVGRAQLATQAFIIRETGSGSRLQMELFFRELGIRPPVLMRIGSNETIKQAVMAGMGLAFLSLHTVAAEVESGRLLPLRVPGLPLTRHWHVVHRRARILSPAAEALRYFLIEHAGEFLARHFSCLAPHLPVHPDQTGSTSGPKPASKRATPRRRRARRAT